MSPKLSPAVEMQPAPQFETFEAFVAGTYTLEAATAKVKANPTKYKYAYGLRKLNPATGEMVSRYMLREHTVREVMDRIKGEPVVVAPRVTQNGVKYPSEKSVAFKIWTMLDNLSNDRTTVITKTVLSVASDTNGFNLNNVMTECSLWRKFHGLTWKVSK